MNCPYCDAKFSRLLVNINPRKERMPEYVPLVCTECASIGIMHEGVVRRILDEEMESLKQAPVWRELLDPVQKRILEHKAKGVVQ